MIVMVKRVRSVEEATELEACGVDIIGVDACEPGSGPLQDDRILSLEDCRSIGHALKSSRLLMRLRCEGRTATDILGDLGACGASLVELDVRGSDGLEMGAVLVGRGVGLVVSGVQVDGDSNPGWREAAWLGQQPAFVEVDSLTSLQHFTGRHSQVQEGAGGAGRRGWNGDLSLLLSGVTPRDLPSLPEGLGGAVGLSFALGSRKWGRRQAREWSWPLPVLLDTIRAARSPNLAEARLESCETCGRVHGVDGSAWTGPGRVARGGVILGGLQGRGTNSRGFREAVNERDRSVLIEVPGGLFPMGTDEGALHEEPVHAVRVASLWIGKYPVTNEQFRRFVCATGHDAGSWWRTCAARWGDDAPVVHVSWFDANAYAQWAGLRLPTEAEWEYVARGPQGWMYPWGSEWDADHAVWGENSGGGALAVGSRPSGASWCGALDMVGNVWEWCATMLEPYPYCPRDGRENLAGLAARVRRGGSWSGFLCHDRHATARRCSWPTFTDHTLGFRCARMP